TRRRGNAAARTPPAAPGASSAGLVRRARPRSGPAAPPFVRARLRDSSAKSECKTRAAKGTNFDYVIQVYDQRELWPSRPPIRVNGRVQYGQSARYPAGAFVMLPERESRCCA